MSSSIALSTAAMSGTTRPALSQLVAANTLHTRSIWRCARNSQASGDKTERVSRRIDKYHRHPLANTRSKAEARDWPSTTHRQSTGGWASWRSRSGFSDFSIGREHTSYNAAFGNKSFKPDSVSPGFVPSFLKTDQPANGQNTEPSKAHLQDFNFARSPQPGHFEGLRYDPISGRMAPLPPQPETQYTNAEQSGKRVIDCPPGSEVEAKFASNPSLVEDGQFQPGPCAAARHFTSQSIPNSQSVDCSPGSELETLFAANPASFQEARVMPRVPEESAHKPNIHIACPPGNEFEALLISESIPSNKPHAETYKVHDTVKLRDADAGIASLRNVECAPGSELETMFISKPATRADQSRPSQAFDAHPGAKQAGVSVDCSPGSELEAKFASELPAAAAQQSPKAEGSSLSVDCSPGSEVEAKIVSDIANRKTEQPEATSTIECAPGSELEALFISDPAAAANTQSKPAVAAEPANTKKANITMDCQPGNELEAKMISDAATTGNTEDLGALQASEIRARYAPKPRPARELDFDGSEDLVGDFLLQNQEVATEKTGDSAAFRILAYDSSESQVSTTEAQSFFGENDTAQPHEILARLHSPAKFVPYFAQLQQEGFEIATGGGDILVFKKALNAPKQAVSQPAVEQNPLVHSQIAQYLRHDSYPTDSATSSPGSSFKPPPGSGSSIPGGRASSAGPESWLRRVIFAGAATAASFYAIGAVIEYFRTGGQDGRGIDGFTAFESERRRRE